MDLDMIYGNKNSIKKYFFQIYSIANNPIFYLINLVILMTLLFIENTIKFFNST